MGDTEFKEVENEQLLPAIADNTLVALADEVEKRFDAMSKIKRIALKLTNWHDWVDESGRPYLQASGAEKVARLFGISWRISEPMLENLEGGHFSFTYKGEFTLAGATIEAIGTRSSKDGFFKKYQWEGEEGNKRKVELPVSEIDRGDVKKAAYTNLLGNGITRLLGIRNLTYDDLAEYAGIKKEQIVSVQYKKDGKPASVAPKVAPSNPEVAKAPGPIEAQNLNMEIGQNDGAAGKSDSGFPITDIQIKAISTLLTSLNISDELAKHEKVAAILGLAEIPTSMKKLTKGQGSKVIMGLQKETSQGLQRYMKQMEVNDDSRKSARS